MRFVFHFEAMTTPCEIILFTSDAQGAERCAKAILKESKRLEMKYSFYREQSLLYRLNHRTADRLDPETSKLIKRAKYYCQKTDGIFDITIGTFKALYLNENDPKHLAEKKALLLPYTGCNRFTIKKNRIIFDNPYTKIDLGGFAKEYAVDRAALIAKRFGMSAALINFGGDIYALGRKENGTRFRIGIKNPENSSQHLHYIELENQAIATSASNERQYVIGTETYSHILSKSEIDNAPLSASVISESCVESGVFATAIMIDPSIQTDNDVIIIPASTSIKTE